MARESILELQEAFEAMLPQAAFQNSLELPKNITRSKKNINRF